MQRTFINASKSSLTISVRRKSLNKILMNRQRSTTIIAHKINSSKTSNYVRLVGGADVSEEPDAEEILVEESPASIQEVPPPTPLTPSLSSVKRSVDSSPVEEATQSEDFTNEKSQDKQSGPCCFCLPQTPRSVGDRKVDEIINYVHQNLEEAGKALATLGENFEHDLKMIIVDVLGRIKQWSGIVQNKLDGCKNEIDNLRKELLARVCEIEDLKTQIADYQNASLDSKPLNKIVRLDQKEERIHKKIDAENSKEIEEDAVDQIVEKDAKRIDRAKKIKVKDEVQVDEIEEEDDAKEIDRVNNKKIRIKDQVRVDEIEEEDDAKEIARTKKIAIKDAEEEDAERAIDEEDEEEFLQKRRDKKEAPTVKKMKREAELESEITQLRKEYDRVIKERAEYENAIQRALLRGVSSLNVEALRVLRCPPIPCCSPCAPCPATAGIIPPEPVLLCPAKNAKRRLGSAAATICSAKVSRDRNGDQTDCTTKRPCANPCCLANRNRKSANGSMIFLLRQGNERNLRDEDAIPVCGSTVVKKIELPPLRKFET